MTTKMTTKKLYIENLGCAKNQVDAEVLAYNLQKSGYQLCLEAEEADLIIVNTCGFLESAKEESLSVFFTLKEKYPDKKFIISGCLAQRYPKELFKEIEETDAVFGNRDLSKINQVVEKVEKSTRNLEVPKYPDPDKESDTRDKLFNFPGSAFLKISEGCNHWCSYCAIPVIRGELRSRPEKAVLKEAERLVKSGIKEINIVAQDLAAYGYDFDKKSHFVDLIRKITAIEGNFKVRMLYIHPDWMSDSIIDEVKNNNKILKYFDIPFQHASEEIIKSMNRTGNPEIYAGLIEKIRREIPEAVIRTTLMLGFPGDTQEHFETLKKFVKRCNFNWMGSFTYSREEDTKAFDMTTEEEHDKLHKQAVKWQKSLEKIQEKITEKKLQEFVGKEFDVLIEENIEGEDLSIGRIYAQAPDVDGSTVVMGRNMVPGNIYRCGITKVNGVDLEAVRIE